MAEHNPLAIQHLSHGYGNTPVLHDISLQVEPGELVAVLGTSGSGKSTLLRSVAGFVTPQQGSISLGGVTVVDDGKESVPAEKRGVGMVFQDYALFEHMTITENVAFGLDPVRRGARVSELLQLVGLGGFENRRPNTLSGGQQQRVALARALAPNPHLLVLDEPFANLDGSLRHEISAEIQRILRDQGVAALLVTHERTEALGLADRVAILDGQSDTQAARLVQTGTPEEVYTAPATAGAAILTGQVTLVPGKADGLTVETAIGNFRLHAPQTGACQVILRPEMIRVGSDGPHRVQARRFEGAGYSLDVETPAGLVHVHVQNDPVPASGEAISLTVSGPVATVPC